MAANPSPSQVTGTVEVDVPWFGDFSLTDTGDLLLAADTASGPNGTIERIARLLLTSPLLTDQNGNPIQPDDIFHPTWGAGLRAYVGGSFTSAMLQGIQAATLSQLRQDPGVAFTPVPIVTLSMTNPMTALMNVTFWSPTGQKSVLPTITLSPSGIFVGV